MAEAIFVGTACVDILLEVDAMPPEDTETRVKARATRAGGNACNSAVAAASLGLGSAWVGASVDPTTDANAAVCLDAMSSAGVVTRGAAVRAEGAVPTSYIVSVRGGSRTIFHHRQLAELQADELAAGLGRIQHAAASGTGVRWAHFECRGDVPGQLVPMLQACAAGRWAPDGGSTVVGLELEKPRPGERDAVRLADVVVVAAEWERKEGKGVAATDPLEAARAIVCGGDALPFRDDATVILTCGAAGCVVVPRAGALRAYRGAPSAMAPAPDAMEALAWLEGSTAARPADRAAPVAGSAAAASLRSACAASDVAIVHVPSLTLPDGWLERGDSVGAGDAFAGGLVMRMVRDPAAGVVEAARFASAVAAAKLGCAGLGGVKAALCDLSAAAHATAAIGTRIACATTACASRGSERFGEGQRPDAV